jgi:hypothetical protein
MTADEAARPDITQAFDLFRSFVHNNCTDGHRIVLDRRGMRLRKLCGEHGSVIPNECDQCPVCTGSLSDFVGAFEDYIE